MKIIRKTAVVILSIFFLTGCSKALIKKGTALYEICGDAIADIKNHPPVKVEYVQTGNAGSQRSVFDDEQEIREFVDAFTQVKIADQKDIFVTDDTRSITFTFEDDIIRTIYFDSSYFEYKAEDGFHTFELSNTEALNKLISNNQVREVDLAELSEPSAADQVTWTTYTDSQGLFSMQIPEGWIVISEGGYLGHLIRVYDPVDSDRQIIYVDSLQGVSNYEAQSLIKASTGQEFAVFTNVEELISAAGQYTFGYTFETIEALENNVYHGLFDYRGLELEGMATAVVVDTGGTYVGSTLVDLMYGDGFQMITAFPQDFTDWEPVLTRSISSLTFTDKFWQGRADDWAQIARQSMIISQTSNNISSMQMSAWEQRSSSYDIRRQEESDARLGYERYVDQETGAVYKVKNGKMDDYQGTRYTRVESGSQWYNQPVSGYVE